MDFKIVKKLYLENRDKLLSRREVLGVGLTYVDTGERRSDSSYRILVLASPVIPAGDLLDGLAHEQELGRIVDIRSPELTPLGQPKAIDLHADPKLGPICDANPDFMILDPPEIHRLSSGNKGGGAASLSVEVGDFPNIFVIVATDDLVRVDSDGNEYIDWIEAFSILKKDVGDDFDFVFFNVDREGDLPGFGNHSLAVFNDLKGIGHHKGPEFDQRRDWGTAKLQSVQLTRGYVGLRTTLHETAHRWTAYGAGELEDLHQNNITSDQRLYHWGCWFDNDSSCMDYDWLDWQRDGYGSGYHTVGLSTPTAFSPLDRYLMGFLGADELPPVQYFPVPEICKTNQAWDGSPGVMSAAEIVQRLGPRITPSGEPQKWFRQAFVLITSEKRADDPGVLRSLVQSLDELRVEHEETFTKAVEDPEVWIDTRLVTESAPPVGVVSDDSDPNQDPTPAGDPNAVPADDPVTNDGPTPEDDPTKEEDVTVKKRGTTSDTGQHEPVVLVRVKIKNTTTKPRVVKFKVKKDPVAPQGNDSDPVHMNGGQPIPPQGEAIHEFAGNPPSNIYQMIVCSQVPMEATEHWVITISDETPAGDYPRSILSEFVENQDPLARGLITWMLANPDLDPENGLLHTVATGPDPDCFI